MNENKSLIKDIDDYISQFSPETQEILNALRETIRNAAPKAEEKISYQMPTFFLHKNLIHFAAFKKHIGLYPGPEAILVFKKELEAYKTSKGAIQFPIDQPIPYGLVNQIVQFKVNHQVDKKI